MREFRVKIEATSWHAGYKAGLEGKSSQQGNFDGYSFSSGYIEGEAARLNLNNSASPSAMPTSPR